MISFSHFDELIIDNIIEICLVNVWIATYFLNIYIYEHI